MTNQSRSDKRHNVNETTNVRSQSISIILILNKSKFDS